ncbi:MAG: DUF3575 domain-containing protein [Bacteroidaceae bacterium]|nr:DUF3575 domain-containing protein [Bacteroidaceae bacterium]
MYKRLGIIGKFALLLLLLGAGQKALGQQHIAVRNNLCYDLSGTPNLGFDMRISPHWTWGMNAGYRPWPTDDNKEKKWRHLLLAPELRHWNDSVFHRTYWGLNLIYSHYNVGGVKFPLGMYKSVRDHRLQGDLAAIGAFYGRTWRLNSWFRLEAELGVGIGYAWAKKYDCPHCGAYLGRDDKPFLVPKLAVNLVLDHKKKEQPIVPPPIVEPVEPPTPEEPVLAVSRVRPATVSDRLLADNPVLAEYKDYIPYDQTRILRKEKGALFVHFPLGSSDLQHDYRDNAATLDRIIDITQQIVADTASNVRLIQIIGLASIEGAVKGNETLAANRAEALKRYIQQHVSTPDSIYELANGGEAWTELRDQINDAIHDTEVSPAHAAALREAIALIDSEPDLTRREQRLRQLNGGNTFRYIFENLLPQQRNSGYLRIYFDRVPDRQAEIINQASELIGQEHYQEALTLLKTVSTDERAQNALGVALYMTGQKEQAMQCFRRAAANGNADAQRNLRELEK